MMERNDLKRMSIATKLSLLCIMIYIFFNSTSTTLNYCMLGLAMFMVIIEPLSRGEKFNVITNKTCIIYLVILIYSSASLIITPEVTKGFRFVIILLFIFIYYIALTMNSYAYVFAMRAMALCSGIHVFFTLLQIIAPDVVAKVNTVILMEKLYYDNTLFLGWGYYSGISSQTHMNAFYISISCCILFSIILNHTNSEKSQNKMLLILYYIIITLVIIALVATQKRGILLANMAAIFLTMLIYLRSKRNGVFIFLSTSIILFLVAWLLLQYNPLAQALYMRFTDTNNFMSDRDIIYVQVLESFSKNPVLGNGVASTYSIVSTGAHNIYLQLMNDYGLLGTLLFMIFFWTLFVNTIKVYYKERDLIGGNSRVALVVSIYMQIYFFVYGIVGNPLYDNFIFFAYIIVCSFPYSISRNRKTIGNKNKTRIRYGI